MRLDVGVLAAEELGDAVDGEAFDVVVILAAGVVAFAGVALAVLVGHAGAGGGHDGGAGVVLTGDQLEGLVLALLLQADDFGDLWIGRADQVVLCGGDSVGLGGHGGLQKGRQAY